MMMMHVFLQSSTKKTFQVTLVSEKGLTLLSATFYKNYSDNGGLFKILDLLQIMLTCSSTTCHICLMTVVLFFSIIYIFTLMFFIRYPILSPLSKGGFPMPAFPDNLACQHPGRGGWPRLIAFLQKEARKGPICPN